MFAQATRIRFYLGLVQRDGVTPVTPWALAEIRESLGRLGAGGWTEYDGVGQWDGGEEPSKIFEFIVFPPSSAACDDSAQLWAETLEAQALNLADLLGALARQDCVLVTIEDGGPPRAAFRITETVGA